MPDREVVLCQPVRSAIGTQRGGWRDNVEERCRPLGELAG